MATVVATRKPVAMVAYEVIETNSYTNIFNVDQ